MDGSDRMVLINDSIEWPNGLTVDYTADRIYWTDAGFHVIESAHLDGKDRKVIKQGLYHPFGITVFEDNVYWSDWHYKSIYSINKVTGKGFQTLASSNYINISRLL